MKKMCTRCGEEKLHKLKKDGRTDSYCIECRKEYDREWHQTHKQKVNPRRQKRARIQRSIDREWLNDLKKGPCQDCGLTWPPYVMEFDHVRGEKSFNIGDSVVTRSRELILQEIAKCDLVCANCHRVRTFTR